MGIKNNIYVEAAVSTGAKPLNIFMRHVLPNLSAPIMVLATTGFGIAILAEATLSFLGFGVPPDVISWGSMLSWEGRIYMETAPMLAIWPGLCLSFVVWNINMFGDAIRDLMDPRLRGGLGRYGIKVKKLNKKSAS